MFKTFVVGEILTETDINKYLEMAQSAVKLADQTVNNSSVFVNDNTLVLPVVASASYFWSLDLHFTSGITPDFKFTFTVPSGASGVARGQAVDATPLVTIIAADVATTVVIPGAAAGVVVRAFGWLTTSTTAGNLQLQWAQNTANASNTIVLQGSALTLIRTA